MATNRDLLKEAIADAKAVKETAIANAKAALQEAFTPQLHSMFAMKLQEMEEEDLKEEGFGKMNADSDEGFSQGMDEKALDEEEDKMNEIDLEELLRELELEEGEAEGLYEAEEEEEESEEEEEESEEGEDEGEPLDLEDMTDEDLKSMIEDVIKDMIGSGELEAGHEGGEEEEAKEMGIEDEEEVDLAELLREIEEMEKMEEKPMKEIVGMFKKDPAKKIAGALKEFDDFLKSADADKIPGMKEEFGNLTPNDAKYKDLVVKYLEHPKFTTAAGDYMSSIGQTTSGAKYLAYFRDIFGKEVLTTPAYGPEGRGGANVGEAMEDELKEAYSTINALKSELNEINLLNAKLLYTNKIFKAKNLNENQKVKVLSSFDKATTVGEVKMVFETLNEGIKVSKNTIKENLGSASKAMVTPNAKKPIVESNEAFLRMQKLAGII
jgi:hypothetical protein